MAEVAKLAPPPDGKRMPKFMAILRDLDSGNYLVTTYQILSKHVHVTHAAVTSFLRAGRASK